MMMTPDGLRALPDSEALFSERDRYALRSILGKLEDGASSNSVGAPGEGVGSIPPTATPAVSDNWDPYGFADRGDQIKVVPTKHPLPMNAREEYLTRTLEFESPRLVYDVDFGVISAWRSSISIGERIEELKFWRYRDWDSYMERHGSDELLRLTSGIPADVQCQTATEIRARTSEFVHATLANPAYQAALDRLVKQCTAPIKGLLKRIEHDPDALSPAPVKQAPVRKNVQRRNHSLAAEALCRAADQTRLVVEGGSHRNLVGAVRECKSEML